MNLNDLPNGDKLACVCRYLARSAADFSRALIFNHCKAKLCVSATLWDPAKVSAAEGTFVKATFLVLLCSFDSLATAWYASVFSLFLSIRWIFFSKSWLPQPSTEIFRSHIRCVLTNSEQSLNGAVERQWTKLFHMKVTWKCWSFQVKLVKASVMAIILDTCTAVKVTTVRVLDCWCQVEKQCSEEVCIPFNAVP